MQYVVSWKDSLSKEEIAAQAAFQEGSTIRFEKGDSAQHIPLEHVWYWQTPLPEKRSQAESTVKLKLCPKDNPNVIILDVENYCLEGETLLVIFSEGHARNYPLRHLKYWESAPQ